MKVWMRGRRAFFGRDAFDQALKQMVMGVDPAGVDDAAGSVDHAFAGQADHAQVDRIGDLFAFDLPTLLRK